MLTSYSMFLNSSAADGLVSVLNLVRICMIFAWSYFLVFCT